MLLVQADSEWLYVVPWGLRKLLVWIDQRYDHPDIYILENGVDCPKESDVPLPGKLCLTMAKYHPAKKRKVELFMVQLFASWDGPMCLLLQNPVLTSAS